MVRDSNLGHTPAEIPDAFVTGDKDFLMLDVVAGMPKPSVISFGGFRFAAPTLHFEQGRGCLRYFCALK